MPRIREVNGMTVDELQREQEQDLPAEDLTPYRGQWVALRDGHVVASALDAVELRDRDEVQETDELLLVPAHGEGLYLL